MLYHINSHIVILVLIIAAYIGTPERKVNNMLQNDGKWRAQHPDYYLIKVNCPLCNKVVSKRNLTRHQRSEKMQETTTARTFLKTKTYNLSMAAQILNISYNVRRGKMSLHCHTN